MKEGMEVASTAVPKRICCGRSSVGIGRDAARSRASHDPNIGKLRSATTKRASHQMIIGGVEGVKTLGDDGGHRDLLREIRARGLPPSLDLEAA